jgi:hypothetical protein
MTLGKVGFETEELESEFFSQYINGFDMPLTLRGFHSSVPLLQCALTDWTMRLVLDGVHDDMILSSSLGHSAAFLVAPKVKFIVYNPIDLPMTLIGFPSMTISFNSQAEKTKETDPGLAVLAKINASILHVPFTIPPKTSSETKEYVPLELTWDYLRLKAAIARLLLAPNVLYIHLAGNMPVRMEPNDPMTLAYEQHNISVYFDHWKPGSPYEVSKKAKGIGPLK